MVRFQFVMGFVKIVAVRLHRLYLSTQLRTPPDRTRGLDRHKLLRGDQVIGGGHQAIK